MLDTFAVSDLERFLEEYNPEAQRYSVSPSTKRWTIDKQSFLTEVTGSNKRYDETIDTRNVSSPRCPSPVASPRPRGDSEHEQKRPKVTRSLPLISKFEPSKTAQLAKSMSLGALEERKKESAEVASFGSRPKSEFLSEKLAALERYEVLKTLLINEKGEIYLVKEKLTDALYVLKLIPKKSNDKLNLTTMAKREAQVLQKLNLDLEDDGLSHSDKNMLQLQATWEYEQYNMVMLNWENGIQLREVIGTYGRLSEKEAKTVCVKLLHTLHFLHSHNIVLGGDLNPGVVLISSNREVRIMDFGSSSETSEAPGSGPESDMFSLGLLVYFILTSKPLLPADGQLVEQDYIQSKIIEDLEADSFSVQCKYFLEKLLQVNPLRRMSAEEALTQPWISSEDLHVDQELTFFLPN